MDQVPFGHRSGGGVSANNLEDDISWMLEPDDIEPKPKAKPKPSGHNDAHDALDRVRMKSETILAQVSTHKCSFRTTNVP
jgi:hypothetical protein